MIRKLTADEIEQVNAAKKAANDKLKEMRSTLRGRRRHLSRVDRTNLENQLAALETVTGKPVVIVVDGNEITLDYELLSKFLKSLYKQRYHYSLRIEGRDFDRRLTIHYQHAIFCTSSHGVLTLFELPPRKRDLLQGLPRVELGFGDT